MAVESTTPTADLTDQSVEAPPFRGRCCRDLVRILPLALLLRLGLGAGRGVPAAEHVIGQHEPA